MSFAQRLVSGHPSLMLLGLAVFLPFSEKQHLSHPVFNCVNVHYLLPFSILSSCVWTTSEELKPPDYPHYMLVSSWTASWISLTPVVRKPGHRIDQFALRPTGNGKTNVSTTLSWGTKPNSQVHLRGNTYIALILLDQIPSSSITFHTLQPAYLLAPLTPFPPILSSFLLRFGISSIPFWWKNTLNFQPPNTSSLQKT